MYVCEPQVRRSPLGNTLPVVFWEEHDYLGDIREALPSKLCRFSWYEDCVKAFLLFKREKGEKLVHIQATV